MDPKILLIEDDDILGESLVDYLTINGFQVRWINRDFGRIPFQEERADLIILDLILPGTPGEVILQKIRRADSSVPVLILTTKNFLESKRFCFQQGADDYLVKPFDMEELILRIEALLRRTRRESDALEEDEHLVKIGDCVVDLKRRVVLKQNKEIPVSRRIWDLIAYLVKNKGRIVDKSELLENVWYDAHVTESVIRAYIKELRKIFPADSIETFKGRGYRLK